MSKPILIGFFLAFVSGSGVPLRLLEIPVCGDDRCGALLCAQAPDANFVLLARIALFSALYQAEQPSQHSANDLSADRLDRDQTVVWLMMVPVLIAISLYTLYEIRKRQEVARQLAGVRSELLTLFNNAPCGFHSLDEHGVFLNVNNTLPQWLGYEKEEMTGKLRFSGVVEGGEDTSAEQILALNNGASQVPVSLIKKSGEKMQVMLTTINMGGFKAYRGQLYCTIDNSECHQALERMKNLDQELEAFSYSVSHDLRAPLRSIDGYSRILQEDYAGKLDEEGKRVLTVIMTNAKRMGKLIDDLLEFGRLGRKSIQRANVDMTGLVNNIVAELRSQGPQRNIEVHVGRLHTASGDADMMRQLWLNLLDNAFKYSGKKDLAVINVRSFESDEGEICYEVVDNGVGFDMKYAPKLFGVFQRLHKIQDFSGTGVGLAMVKRIVTRHGGRVWAEGSLTDGAKFYFTIPLENEHA